MNALQRAHQRLARLAQAFRVANPGDTSSNDYFYWQVEPETLDASARDFSATLASGSFGLRLAIEQGEGGELVVDPSSRLDAGPYDPKAARGNYTKALKHLHAALWTTLGRSAHPDAVGLLAPLVRSEVRTLGKQMLNDDPFPPALDAFWSDSIPPGDYQPNPAYEILKDLIFGRNGIEPSSSIVLSRYYISIATTWNPASKRFSLVITFKTKSLDERFSVEIQGKHREPIKPNLRISQQGLSYYHEHPLDMRQLEDFLSDEENIAHRQEWFLSEEDFYLWLFSGKEDQRQYHSMIYFDDETDQLGSRFLVCANRTKKCLHISKKFPGLEPNDTIPRVYAVEQPNPEAVSMGWKFHERTASRERFLIKAETSGGKRKKTQIPTWISVRPDLWTPAGLRYLLDPHFASLSEIKGAKTTSNSPAPSNDAPTNAPRGRAPKSKPGSSEATPRASTDKAKSRSRTTDETGDSEAIPRYEVMGERGKYLPHPSDEGQAKLSEATARVRALRRLANLETRHTATPPNTRGLDYIHTSWKTTKGRITLSGREPLGNTIVDPYDFGLDWSVEWVKHHKAKRPQTSLKLCIKGYGFDDEVSARVAEMEAGSVHTKPYARIIPCFIVGPREDNGDLGVVLCSFTPVDPENQGGIPSDEPFIHKPAAARSRYQSACRAAAALAFVFGADIEALLWPNLAQRQIYSLYLDGARLDDAGDQPPRKDSGQALTAKSAKGRNFLAARARAVETAETWLDWLRSWHRVDYAPLPSYGSVAPFDRTLHGEDHDNAKRALEGQQMLLSALTNDERPRAALDRLALDVLTILDKYSYAAPQKRVQDAKVDQAIYRLRGEQ